MKVVKTYEFWSDYSSEPAPTKDKKEITPEEWLDDIARHMGWIQAGDWD